MCPAVQTPGKCWSLHSVALCPQHGEGDGSTPRCLSYIKKISAAKRRSKATPENTQRTHLTPLSLPNDPTSTSAETQTPISHPSSCQGLPHHQDEAVIVQDGGFQGAGSGGSVAGAGREAKQGQRSDCNFPSRERERVTRAGRNPHCPESAWQLSLSDTYPKEEQQMFGVNLPQDRNIQKVARPDVQIGTGRRRKLPFSPGGLAGRGFH